MSGNSVNPYASSFWPNALPARQLPRTKEIGNGLTPAGILLWLIGASLFLSGFKDFRPQIGGLHFQPYLIPLGIGALLAVLTRLQKLPAIPFVCLTIFVLLYAFSMAGAQAPLEWMNPKDEILKIVAGLVTIITVALLVRSRGDFVFGVTGLCVGVALLATRGLQDENAADRLIDSANKNSYSLYALPAVLLALYLAARTDWKQVTLRRSAVAFCILCTLAISFVMLKGANRSGYLGLAVVLLELAIYSLRGSRLSKFAKARTIVRIGIVAALAVGLLIYFKATEAFERRFEQTVTDDNGSDTLRINLFVQSFKIGLANPVLGIGPQLVPFELARRMPEYGGTMIDTHNVIAHIFAGSGLICFGALIAGGITLWYWRPKGKSGKLSDNFYDARWLLRMMLALWCLRGLFSREILYIPGFNIGLGLAIGLCICESTFRSPMSTPELPSGSRRKSLLSPQS